MRRTVAAPKIAVDTAVAGAAMTIEVAEATSEEDTEVKPSVILTHLYVHTSAARTHLSCPYTPQLPVIYWLLICSDAIVVLV